MNTTKTTKKTTTKKTTSKDKKYVFVVNLVGADAIEDVALAFAKAKFEAKLPLNNTDIEAFKNEGRLEVIVNSAKLMGAFFDALIFACDKWEECQSSHKDGIFKRFWNWITRKK